MQIFPSGVRNEYQQKKNKKILTSQQWLIISQYLYYARTMNHRIITPINSNNYQHLKLSLQYNFLIISDDNL